MQKPRGMKTSLAFLVFTFAMSSSSAWANRLEEWKVKTAEGQAMAVRMDMAVRQNAKILKAGEPVNCSQPGQVQVLRLSYRDGRTDSVLLIGKDIYNWINRKVTAAHIENGAVKASTHQILFSANHGGWRWEREPEKANLGSQYNRFADVANVEISEVSLQEAAHCPSPVAPSLREDEVVVGEGVIDAAGGLR